MTAFAIAALSLLAIIAVLVYLPKIRKPALWVFGSLAIVGGLGFGGWFLKVRHEERASNQLRERELSYMVDHVIRKPPHCKSNDPLESHLSARSKGIKLSPEQLKEFRPLPPIKVSATDMKDSDSTGPANQPAGSKGKTLEEVKAGGKPKRTHFTDDEIELLMHPAPAARPPFDPDAFLCDAESKDLTDLVKAHVYELNGFIQDNQDDPRVTALQTVLSSRGIEFRKTCKNLRDEGHDDYELHLQGCK